MLYMLDTDISSYIIKGGYGAVEQHLSQTSPSDLCISAITRAELLYGLKSLPPRHRLTSRSADSLGSSLFSPGVLKQQASMQR
ncbi:MAG TPA: hypothetical protein VGG95_00470 [Edaphobacter sp.]